MLQQLTISKFIAELHKSRLGRKPLQWSEKLKWS